VPPPHADAPMTTRSPSAARRVLELLITGNILLGALGIAPVLPCRYRVLAAAIAGCPAWDLDVASVERVDERPLRRGLTHR
jgi:hypothetical protein